MRLSSKIQRPRVRPTQDAAGKVPLTKYYRSGDPTESASPFQRSNKKKSRYKRYAIRGLDVVVLAALLLGLVYSMLVSSNPKLTVNSYAYRPQKTYQQIASQELTALKNRNKITLDEAGLAAALKARFPEINSVSLELPLLSQRPIIHLGIAAPTFLLSSNGHLYLIDAEGRAVSANVTSEGYKELPIITDQTGYDVSTGKQVLSSGNVSFINTVLAQSKHASVPIGSLTLPPKAQDLYVKPADRPYYVKFFLGGDPLSQSGQFLAAHHQFDTAGGQPSEYIDVRVPGKIFYK
jgi:hypothetical protein